MKRYPLEALREIRDREVEERQQQLTASVAAVDRAIRGLQNAQDCLEAELEQFREEQDREMRRVDAGVARASDFQRAAAYRVLCEGRINVAKERALAAQSAVALANQARLVDENALSEARANAKLIVQHREGFITNQRVMEEAHVEELAIEAWAASHSKDAN